MDKSDWKKFKDTWRDMGSDDERDDFEFGPLTKFMFGLNPMLGFKMLNEQLGIKNDIFDQADQVFSKIERIDIFPTSGRRRGFILVLDSGTALFFYQKGDHFVYDGFEMGEYAKGDVTIFDNVPENSPGPYDL